MIDERALFAIVGVRPPDETAPVGREAQPATDTEGAELSALRTAIEAQDAAWKARDAKVRAGVARVIAASGGQR